MTSELTVVVAATYTAEPLEGPLLFWLEPSLASREGPNSPPTTRFSSSSSIRTATFGRNAGGINVVLVRLEDLGPLQARQAGMRRPSAAGTEELGNALRAFAQRSGTPTIIVAPPASPLVDRRPRAGPNSWPSWREGLREDVGPFDSLHWLGRAENEPATRSIRTSTRPATASATSPIPRWPPASLATAIARRIHAIKSPPSQGGGARLRQHALEGSRRRGRPAWRDQPRVRG